MTIQEAREVISNLDEITFDVDDSCFGGGAKVVQVANVFDSEEEANKLVEALKVLIGG